MKSHFFRSFLFNQISIKTALFLILFFASNSCGGTNRQYDFQLNDKTVMAEDFINQGNYGKAFELFDEAIKNYEKGGKKEGVLFCLDRMGWLKREIGQYGEALELLKQAYPIGVELNGDAAEIDAGIGDVYLLTGASEKAEEHYQKALDTLKDFVFPTSYSAPPSRKKISSLIRKSTAIVHARDNLGTLNYFKSNWDEAIKNLEIAEKLINDVLSVTEHPMYGMFVKLDDSILEGIGFCYTIMGACYSEKGDFEKAFPFFEKGKTAFEKGNRHYGLLLNQALFYKAEYLKPDYKIEDKKFKEYDRFIEKAEGFGALDIAWRACFIIGKGLSEEKRYPEAFTYLARAIDCLELTRSRLREDTLKKMFTSSVQDVYAEIIEVLFKMKEFDQGFNYLERAKARAFLDMLAGRSVKAKKSVDPGLVKKEKEVQGQIDIMARRLKLLSIEERKSERSKFNDLLAERSRILEDIKSQSLEYASTTTVTTVDTKKLASRIDDNSAIISYFINNDRTIIWILKKEGVSAISVQINKDALGDLVRSYRDAIYQKNELFIKDFGQMLSGFLVKPLQNKISGIDSLYIVPSERLHYLPFSSLPYVDEGFMVQNYAITILPNASSIFFLDKKVSQDKGTIFAMGNPDLEDPDLALEFAEKEVQSITQDFSKSTALTGKDARETALKANKLADIGFIHIAAHGKYDTKQPLKSAIMLAKDNENDGRLETFEIFSLTMNPRLVVLSACESGIGKIEGGDEVQGLNRAFLYAGSGGVIASLWSVSDQSTYQLMDLFYNALKKLPTAEALREAQLKLMDKYPSPFYWAPFYFTGMSN